MVYMLCIMFLHSLFHSLSRDKDMYIIQCSLQGWMKIQEKHNYEFFNRSIILYEGPKNDFQSWVARFDGIKLCL